MSTFRYRLVGVVQSKLDTFLGPGESFIDDFTKNIYTDITVNDDLLLPDLTQIMQENGYEYIGVASGVIQPIVTEQLYSRDFIDPDSEDWALASVAFSSSDGANSAIKVRRFDPSPYGGVGFSKKVPSGASRLRITLIGRADVAPSAEESIGLVLYNREVPNDEGVIKDWNASALLDIVVPTNAKYQHYTTGMELASERLEPGRSYVFELARRAPGSGKEFTDRWILWGMTLEWF